jgi:hypothetical protein
VKRPYTGPISTAADATFALRAWLAGNARLTDEQIERAEGLLLGTIEEGTWQQIIPVVKHEPFKPGNQVSLERPMRGDEPHLRKRGWWSNLQDDGHSDPDGDAEMD